MTPDQSSTEVREAVEELLLYFSDVLPPLVVADTFKLLIQYPPGLMASNVHSWTSSQYRAGSGIKVSDYLFYAFKKVFLMGEFRLVPKQPFAQFLAELKTLVLAKCPDGERETLRHNLERLGEDNSPLNASVDDLIRGKLGDRAPAPERGSALSFEELLGLRRFSLLLDRLGTASARDGEGGPDPFAAAIALAARSSPTSEDFEANLKKLRDLGMAIETVDIFRALAKSLPGWEPPEPPPPSGEGGAETAKAPPPPPESPPLEAMHKIVAQPEDPLEVARRFIEMVKLACERFNEGSLPQAVTMLDLADRIVGEKRVDSNTVEAVRQKGDEALDSERLRRYAEMQRYHALLRRVLSFFRGTQPHGLLEELLREMKRERRKLILQLLEIHGVPARREAMDRLRSSFGQAEGDERWYFRRNLLYLLRRIPPPESAAPSDEDVDAAVRHAVLRFPAPLVKEAVANLGQLKHERAESTLIGLLDGLEKMLFKPGESTYDPREVRLLLDRVVAALARFGTAKARRAVVEHCFKKKAELGDTISRLSELAGQDLSGDTELVEELLAALKSNSPHKVFGILLHPNDHHARHLIEALSSTPAPAVRAAFENLASKFPNLEVGKAAAKVLATLDGAAQIPKAPYDTRSGEMEAFGLPGLIQNLAEGGLAGTLTLKDMKGEFLAEIGLRDRKLATCETRGLSGEEAFYQLLERPTAATFVFERKFADGRAEPPGGSLLEVLPLCQEGMRRYDEFQQAAAMVPDSAKLRATSTKPEHHPDELDGMFVNGLWNLISGGATPGECQGALKADSYRVRRQLAHWVETGALTIT
jgi:hypothetical protein